MHCREAKFRLVPGCPSLLSSAGEDDLVDKFTYHQRRRDAHDCISQKPRKTSSSTLFDSPPNAKKKAPPVSNADIELKIAPVKKAARIAAKVREYRQENEEDGFPFCQRVLDILRASFIVNTAKEMHMAFEGIRSSGAFKLIRLKNKICDGSPPFNLHLNALFWPKCCRVPMVIEIQFYFRSVYGLQQRQHLAYELRRATSVQEVS